MIKKIVLPLAVIAIAAGTTISATGAFFSDSEKSEANVFKAGTLEISGNMADGYFTVDGELMPGDSTSKSYEFTVSADSYAKADVTYEAQPNGNETPNATNDAFKAKLSGTYSLQISTGGGNWTTLPLVTGTDYYTLSKNATYRITVTTTLGTDAEDDAQGGKANGTVTLQAVQSANNPTPSF